MNDVPPSLIHMLKSYPLLSQDVTLSGDKVIREVIKLKGGR